MNIHHTNLLVALKSKDLEKIKEILPHIEDGMFLFDANNRFEEETVRGNKLHIAIIDALYERMIDLPCPLED